MSGFEMAMPLVGLAAGRGVHLLVGAAADYLAITVLALLGTWMLFHEERQEVGDAIGSGAPRGLAIVAIGLAISLDEFAIGFTIGLLHLSIWVAILLIGAQAFLFAQLGLRLGARLNQAFRERAEQFAGVTLFALAALLIVEKL
jgi:putative Mn2+ efflux pump MntP